jgi:hypothetical protein
VVGRELPANIDPRGVNKIDSSAVLKTTTSYQRGHRTSAADYAEVAVWSGCFFQTDAIPKSGLHVKGAAGDSGWLRHFTVSVRRMGCNCSGCCVRDVAVMVMVIVEVPEGVMMLGSGAVATVLLPQPAA